MPRYVVKDVYFYGNRFYRNVYRDGVPLMNLIDVRGYRGTYSGYVPAIQTNNGGQYDVWSNELTNYKNVGESSNLFLDAFKNLANWYNSVENVINSKKGAISTPEVWTKEMWNKKYTYPISGGEYTAISDAIQSAYENEFNNILSEIESINKSGGAIYFSSAAYGKTPIDKRMDRISVDVLSRDLNQRNRSVLSPDPSMAYVQIPNLLKVQKQEELETLRKRQKYEEALNVIEKRLGHHDSKIGVLEDRLSKELNRIELSSISDIDHLRMGLQTQQANSVAPDKFNDLEKSVQDLGARLAGLNNLNARLEKLNDLNVSITQLKEKSDEQGTTFLNRLQATEQAIEDSRQNLNTSIQRIHTDTVQNLQSINTTNAHLDDLRKKVSDSIHSIEADINQRVGMINTSINQNRGATAANERKLQDLRRDLDAGAKNTRELFNIYSEKLSIVKPSKVVTIMPRPTKLADRFRRIGTRGRYLNLMLEPIV